MGGLSPGIAPIKSPTETPSNIANILFGVRMFRRKPNSSKNINSPALDEDTAG